MVRTAGSWGVLGALCLAALAQPMGCGPEKPNASSLEVQAVLADVGPAVITPALEQFQGALQALDAELDAGDRDAAASAWVEAMAVWQRLELTQIGPAAPSLATGGADLRDNIYSWPSVNPCRVDQETVVGEWDDPDFFSTRLVNAYGLDALEHMLHAGEANACPNQVDINAEGSWDALGATEIETRRLAYSSAIVGQLLDDTQTLLDAWGGGFSLDADTYGSDLQALNAVFDGLFYLEKTTKDRKLAEPLGLGECITDCADLVEARESAASTRWIAENLEGFSALFRGGEGKGLDDLLVELGHGDLATTIQTDTDTALTAFRALQDEPIDALLASNPSGLQEAFDTLKVVTDALKGDLATVLVLEIPSEAAGDND